MLLFSFIIIIIIIIIINNEKVIYQNIFVVQEMCISEKQKYI